MKVRTSEEIRKMFLEYFKLKNHEIKESAPLVPHNDDSLLWINSGVAALKPYFDGSQKAENPRIVNIQKSIRTNDIDNVGKTARHHTFFEMMGNFSIGDYFKKEAIGFAYEFLFSKEWIGFDIEDAYVSVHPQDQEAYDIWVNDFNFPKERILKTEDNFWQIGNGPCGPNTEIFIDRKEAYDPENVGEKLFFEDIENDRYVEVWNIVFSQYDGIEGESIESFKELPQKNIDTGMGFERLVSLVQEAETNFDTDLFLPTIRSLEKEAKLSYTDHKMAYRVIADHLRTLVFAISDGALFANEGRGYVLRRLLRRASRFGREIGIEKVFLYRYVDQVVDKMGEFYPNLIENQELTKKLIRIEEERFQETLATGELLLEKAMNESSAKTLDGETVFKLYDTYGFPYELTEEIAAEKGYTLDRDGFVKAMEEQKNRARSSRKQETSMKSQNEELLDFKEKSEFVRDKLELETEIIAIFKDGLQVNQGQGDLQVIFAQSPFYAESGGQVADKGLLDGSLEIIDVQKTPNGQHLHYLKADRLLSVGQNVILSVDIKSRKLIERNHTAVHLLHAVLRDKLGEHVQQAGSYLDDNYLRFDFNHYQALSSKELLAIEKEVNDLIFMDLPVKVEEMDLESAKNQGALAFFGDRYGERVRLVKIANKSIELCGGTHVETTAQIGFFNLVSEESVGSGVRRITAQTSEKALETLRKLEKQEEKLRQDYKIPSQKKLEDFVKELLQQSKAAESQLNKLRQVMAQQKADSLLQEAQVSPSGLSFLFVEASNLTREDFNALNEKLAKKLDVLLSVNNQSNKSLSMQAHVADRAIKLGFKAGDIISEMAAIVGGKGGGRPHFAQGGGRETKNITKLKESFYTKCFERIEK